MRKVFFFNLFILFTYNVYAQNVNKDSLEIQAVIDACITMRDAVAKGDTSAIKKSAEELRNIGVVGFNTLSCEDDSVSSINGHLIFDEAFADSLALGKTTVYDKADDMNRARTLRGQNPDGSYRSKTCFVKAGKSKKYSFKAKGYQEIAVVAEAGGLVTMKIHVTNSAGFDRRFDDTKKVKKGMPQRKTSFELPTDRRNTVELEIINRGKKDCSFVVISN